MKKTIYSTLAIIAISFLSSCGVGGAFIYNHNQNNTQVQLSQSNFRVVEKVKGTSEVSYIMGIGGLKKKQIYQNAYAAMMDDADLTTGSRALANVVSEEHVGGVPPFFIKRTITVSAHVIEFEND